MTWLIKSKQTEVQKTEIQEKRSLIGKASSLIKTITVLYFAYKAIKVVIFLFKFTKNVLLVAKYFNKMANLVQSARRVFPEKKKKNSEASD